MAGQYDYDFAGAGDCEMRRKYHTNPHAEVLFLTEKASKYVYHALLRLFEAFDFVKRHLRVRLFLLAFLFITPSLAMIGGKETRDPDGFRKHVVTIRNNNGGHCTGIVLSKRVILTAAHCFTRPGGYYIGYLNPAFLTQRVNILAVTLHPQYNTGAAYGKAHLHDLALVQLVSDLPPSMVPVILPAKSPVLREDVTPVGFGLSDPNRSDSSLVLRELSLKVAEFSPERGEINLTPTGAYMSAPGHASCKGDSGGPALRFNNDLKKQEVLGVLSWVSGPKTSNSCGLKSIYTDVFSQKNWINETIKGWGLPLL
jgi:hypothetical protein